MSYGQLKIKVFGQEYNIPIKIRISGNMIPDFTIDPTKLKRIDQKTGGFNILSFIQPKITLLVGNRAIEIDYRGNVRETDPSIFTKPTLLDMLAEAGLIPVLVFSGGILFFIYQVFKASRRL